MEISVRPHAEFTVVDLEGELDIYTAPQLRECLIKIADESSGAERVLLDLTKVSFIDSTGLGAIVGALRRFQQREGTLELICGRSPVMRLLTITRLDQVFTIHEQVPANN